MTITLDRRAKSDVYDWFVAVVKVDRRIWWHYTTTILHLRIGARGIEIVNFTTAAPRSPIPDDSSRYARTISRHADGISRYSVPPSAGPLLPLVCWRRRRAGRRRGVDTDAAVEPLGQHRRLDRAQRPRSRRAGRVLAAEQRDRRATPTAHAHSVVVRRRR